MGIEKGARQVALRQLLSPCQSGPDPLIGRVPTPKRGGHYAPQAGQKVTRGAALWGGYPIQKVGRPGVSLLVTILSLHTTYQLLPTNIMLPLHTTYQLLSTN